MESACFRTLIFLSFAALSATAEDYSNGMYICFGYCTSIFETDHLKQVCTKPANSRNVDNKLTSIGFHKYLYRNICSGKQLELRVALAGFVNMTERVTESKLLLVS